MAVSNRYRKKSRNNWGGFLPHILIPIFTCGIGWFMISNPGFIQLKIDTSKLVAAAPQASNQNVPSQPEQPRIRSVPNRAPLRQPLNAIPDESSQFNGVQTERESRNPVIPSVDSNDKFDEMKIERSREMAQSNNSDTVLRSKEPRPRAPLQVNEFLGDPDSELKQQAKGTITLPKLLADGDRVIRQAMKTIAKAKTTLARDEAIEASASDTQRWARSFDQNDILIECTVADVKRDGFPSAEGIELESSYLLEMVPPKSLLQFVDKKMPLKSDVTLSISVPAENKNDFQPNQTINVTGRLLTRSRGEPIHTSAGALFFLDTQLDRYLDTRTLRPRCDDCEIVVFFAAHTIQVRNKTIEIKEDY